MVICTKRGFDQDRNKMNEQTRDLAADAELHRPLFAWGSVRREEGCGEGERGTRERADGGEGEGG